MKLLQDLIAIIEHKLKPTRYYGFYRYRVVGGSGVGVRGSRPDLEAVSTVPGLPDILACDKVSGMPGLSHRLSKSTDNLTIAEEVLVGFEGGNPTRPFVAFYLGRAQELEVALDGVGKMSVVGPSADIPAPPVPVALAGQPLQLWVVMMRGTLVATTAALKATAEATGDAVAIGLANAVATAAQSIPSNIGADYPVGMVSTRLKAQ